MNGRRGKSFICCLCVWGIGVKKLVILLPVWLYSHPDFLKFRFHVAEGRSTARLWVLFSFFLSE